MTPLLWPLGFIAPKFLIYLLSNLSILRVPDEGYSRNASFALNLISTFLLDLKIRKKNSKSPHNMVVSQMITRNIPGDVGQS